MFFRSGSTARRLSALTIAAGMTAAACTSDGGAEESTGSSTDGAVDTTVADASDIPDLSDPAPARFRYPEPPSAPDADAPNDEADAAIADLVTGIRAGALDPTAIDALEAAGDARHGWFVSDLLRFFGGADGQRLVEVFESLTDRSVADDPDLLRSDWLSVTNHLIAWDTPDYSGYQTDKGSIFTQLEPEWAPFFDDADAEELLGSCRQHNRRGLLGT